MTVNKTSTLIRQLREKQGITQSQLADRIGVSDKTISKWETSRGYPDVSCMEPLATALGVSVSELLSGDAKTNRNKSSNPRRTKLYVCPDCGNILFSMGDALISCCGNLLEPLSIQENDDAHDIHCELVEGELYVSSDHEMSKEHYISFYAYVSQNVWHMSKQYPESNAEVRLCVFRPGDLYWYCSEHGLRKKHLDRKFFSDK